jgi:hypothetical protein
MYRTCPWKPPPEPSSVITAASARSAAGELPSNACRNDCMLLTLVSVAGGKAVPQCTLALGSIALVNIEQHMARHLAAQQAAASADGVTSN